jgi:preprotein translocase subunit SecG
VGCGFFDFTKVLLTVLIATFYIQIVMGSLLFFTSLIMIFLILIQRGRGGGLAGALGGSGGSSAFGAKAGDTFTRITAGMAIFWFVLCLLSILLIQGRRVAPPTDREPSAGSAASVPADGDKSPISIDEALKSIPPIDVESLELPTDASKSDPSGSGTGGTGTGGPGSGGPANPAAAAEGVTPPANNEGGGNSSSETTGGSPGATSGEEVKPVGEEVKPGGENNAAGSATTDGSLL